MFIFKTFGFLAVFLILIFFSSNQAKATHGVAACGPGEYPDPAKIPNPFPVTSLNACPGPGLNCTTYSNEGGSIQRFPSCSNLADPLTATCKHERTCQAVDSTCLDCLNAAFPGVIFTHCSSPGACYAKIEQYCDNSGCGCWSSGQPNPDVYCASQPGWTGEEITCNNFFCNTIASPAVCDERLKPAYQGGTHGVCGGNACNQTPNNAYGVTISPYLVCSGQCSTNTDCGPRITLNGSFTFTGISGQAGPLAQTLTIQNTGANNSTLNWTASTNTSWCFVRGLGNPGNITGGPLVFNASSNENVTVSAPADAGTRVCTISVSDPAAVVTPVSTTVTYNIRPTDVSNIQASQTCPATSIILTWNAANSGATAKTYNIYRNTSNSIPGGGPYATSGINSYTDTGTAAGTTYYYWIEVVSGGQLSQNRVAAAQNGSGGITVSNCVIPAPMIALSGTLTFTGVSSQGASVPVSRTLTITNSGVVGSNLLWRAQTNQNWCRVNGVNNSGSITGGPLAQGLSVGVNVTVDAPSNTGVLNCTITVSDNGSVPASTNNNVPANVTYTVSPSNVSGVNAGLAACPARSISLTWTAGLGTAPITYNIYRNLNSGTVPGAAFVTGVSGNSYNDASTSPGNNHYFWVKTVSGGLESPTAVAAAQNPINVAACPPVSADLKINNSDGPVNIARGATGSITWTSTNTNTCTATNNRLPVDANWNGAKALNGGPTASAVFSTNVNSPFTYTLACNDGVTFVTDPVTVNVPACNNTTFNAGNSGVVPPSVPVSGSYVLSCDYGVNSSQIFPIVGSGVCVYDALNSFQGNTIVKFNCTAGNTPGLFANQCTINNDNGPEYYCASNNPVNNLTVTALVCPAGAVTLTPASIPTGNTSAASAPVGWSGGTYASSNSAVATVSGSTVTGVSVGSSNINGSGWTAPNGALNCALSASALTVTVAPPPPPDGGSGCGGACVPAVDVSVACESLNITWTDLSSNELGFRIYRDTDNDPNGATLIHTTNPNITSYLYNIGPDTNPYFYFVASFNAGGELVRVPAGGITAQSYSALLCAANLTGSDKDVMAFSGVNFTPNACNGSYEATPSTVKFFENGLASFRINICNINNSFDDATSVVVTDYLTNLTQPTGGWNAKLDNVAMVKDADACSNPALVNHYKYCSTNQTLLFNVGTVNQNSSRYITLDALISTALGPTSRFNNRAEISFVAIPSGPTLNRRASIPWLPYYSTKGTPGKTEIPPQ